MADSAMREAATQYLKVRRTTLRKSDRANLPTSSMGTDLPIASMGTNLPTNNPGTDSPVHPPDAVTKQKYDPRMRYRQLGIPFKHSSDDE